MNPMLEWTIKDADGNEKPLTEENIDAASYTATAQFGIFVLQITRTQIRKDGRMLFKFYITCSDGGNGQFINLLRHVGTWMTAVKAAENFLFSQDYNIPSRVIRVVKWGDAEVYIDFNQPLTADLKQLLHDLLCSTEFQRSKDRRSLHIEDIVAETLDRFNQSEKAKILHVQGWIVSKLFTDEIKL